jgi:hypothetical protein
MHGIGVPETMGTLIVDIQTTQANPKLKGFGDSGGFQGAMGCTDSKKQLAVGKLGPAFSQILNEHVSSSIGKGKDESVICLTLRYPQ